jgi:hypothetical protein
MIAGSSGEVEDSANLTFNGSLLNVTGNATVSGTLDVNTDATIATAKIEDLTSGRVVLAGTGGEIEDSGNLTFNGSMLTVAGGTTVTGALDVNTSATIATLQVEDLTSGRVVLAGTNGEIEDSANLTFNGSTLALTGSQTISAALTVSGAFTSQGIDDNATQETLQIDNTNVKIMASGVTLGGYASGTKSVIDNFVVDGGTF